ncbi:MAG: glycosyltransferase [Burkholderiales bacterium PBB5]|nr:MAG: glycosyltransferase [Burkholderiales bacterium PBB5]
MKRVLMVAFHFPPLAGSSGIQRTLRFVQQLPQLGWQPLVLSAHPRAYERTGTDLLAEVPDGTVVRRAQALRYVAALARPDRWMSWQWDAVRQGLALVRQYKPDVLWTTYPIATAHAIGRALHQRTGLPWVADFRDPMAQDGYPEDPQVWAAYKRIESAAAQNASACCFTTPSAARTYRQRYADRADRMVVLENGYDEGTFSRAEATLTDRSPLTPGCLTLLHSGIVYPAERDPRPLFEALGTLRQHQPALAARLRLRFRAAVSEDLLHALCAQHGVQDLVEILPPVPYAQALAEMLRADGLLVMQASNCNEQVPAKVYEYLRARRPIVALTDAAGDTWNVLQRAGIGPVAALDDAAAIAALLADFAQQRRLGWLPQDDAVAGASRLARSAALAQVLDQAVARDGQPQP